MLNILHYNALLALLLTLSNQFNSSAALPITSKPIESTAENLAWQAWIMLPPQQQNLEKSRKVTPKSIFILPNRIKIPATSSSSNGGFPDGGAEMGSGYPPIDCPPGQKQFESRCIPTVDIDREQLLIQELQILLQQGSNGGNTGALEYDYDYEDDSMPPMVGNFEPPLIVNGGGGGEPPILIGNNYDDADRLPVEDAPLKFNIFRDKFPTDVAANVPENSKETMGLFDPSVAMIENGTMPEGWKAVNITDLWSDLAKKMQMNVNGGDGDMNEAAGPFFPIAEETNKEVTTPSSTTTTTTTAKTTTVAATKSTNTNLSGTPSFQLSDIDAIMLPAVTTSQNNNNHHQHNQHHNNQQQQNTHQQFAIFKDDNTMQLVTAVANERILEDDRRSVTAQQQKNTEIMELLKVDALLPLNNAASGGTTVTRSTVTPLPIVGTNTVHKDTLSKAIIATTTIPTPFAEMLEAAEAHVSQESDKEERTRSVTDIADDTTITAEEKESDQSTAAATTSGDNAGTATTTNDEVTTFLIPNSSNDASSSATTQQTDETTVSDPIQEVEEEEEAFIAVTAKRDRDPAKQQSDLSAVHEVRKKSKVEPVDAELFDIADNTDDDDVDGDDDDDVDVSEETTPLPSPPEFDMMLPVDADSENGAADLNRFTEKTTVTAMGATAVSELNNEVASMKITTTTAITPTSEIDIATELRIINELVKGKRQGTTTKSVSESTTATATSTTIETTTIKTTAAVSNTAAIKNINDIKQETTAASVKTLPTTIKNDVETTAKTTTTTSWILNAKSGTTPSHKSLIESGNIVTDIETELNSESNAEFDKTTETTTKTTTTTTTTTESTATIWSKLLPFLSFGSTTTTETPDMSSSSSISSSSSGVDFSTNRNSSSSNGIHRRNSKIIRINNLSTNSLSEIESSKIPTEATTTTSTELPTPTTTNQQTAIANTKTENSSPPTFWWLPIGWSLERTAPQPVVTPFRTNKNAVTPVASTVQPDSLLLRFWNAFPGNQKRS